MKHSKDGFGSNEPICPVEVLPQRSTRLGQHLWGNDAFEAASQLMVLEPFAVLPKTRAPNHQLYVIFSHVDESYSEFLKRVESRVSRLSFPVETAHLCLNADTGWKATLARAQVCRLLAATVTRAKGQLTLLSPRSGEPRVTLELLTLVELIRRDYPSLDIQLQTENPDRAATEACLVATEPAEESWEYDRSMHRFVAA